MNPTCLGKIIRRFASSAILTGQLPCDLYGTPRQLEVFSEAFYTTRQFDKTLAECDDLAKVTKALTAKRAAAVRFRREFGVRWPA
jgi:hypothetical protein